MTHEHKWRFEKYCGVDVCEICDKHKGLARCYCGWNSKATIGEELDE